MQNSLTVGQLKEKLANVANDVIIKLASDTGVDQGIGEIVVEDCWYNRWSNKFEIYCNDEDDEWVCGFKDSGLKPCEEQAIDCEECDWYINEVDDNE